MLNNNDEYKYKTQYKDPFVIKKCWNNSMITIQYGVTKLDIIYATINHINLIQSLKILPLKNMYDDVNTLAPVI